MSLVLTVSRYRYGEDMTRGLLYVGGLHRGFTLENEWKNNQKNVSCIPKGEYETEVRAAGDSPSRDYDHLILRDVPDRTYILWHIGNRPQHTQGCILPGETATPDMVGRSTKVFNEIMEKARLADSIKTRVKDTQI